MFNKQLLRVLILLGVLELCLAKQAPFQNQFSNWKKKYGISYNSLAQQSYRQGIFLDNLAKVKSHNADPSSTYQEGTNQFSALTNQQFKQNYLGLSTSGSQTVQVSATQSYTIPADVDWVSQGYVNGVKNQGRCGSCWAFSANGGLQGLSKQAGTLQNFSEQELVQCSKSYGNFGCSGGFVDRALNYVIDNGISTQAQYPYTAKNSKCKKPSGGNPFKLSSYNSITTCQGLADSIPIRPVSVAVDASNWSRYSSGVFNNCGTSLNHAVTLVKIESGNWVIKNSWGISWGSSGYMTLAQGNTCGICVDAQIPFL